MDNNQFNFGNAMTGAAGDITAQLAANQQAKYQAVQDRLKQGMEGAKMTLDLVKETKDPATKVALLNKGVIPIASLITGSNIGQLTPEMLQDPTTEAAVSHAAQLTQDYLSQTPDKASGKPMDINTYKMKFGLLMAASEEASKRLTPEREIMQQVESSVKSNIPGPGNTNTTGVVDPVQGTVTPLTNTATGQQTMSPPDMGAAGKAVDPNKARASLESGMARDEKSLQALVNPAKGKAGLPDVGGNGIINLIKRGGKAPAWSDYNQQEQAQLAAAQSMVQRLTANLNSVNSLRSDQGLEPIEVSPSVAAVAAKLAKIQGIPGSAAADPNQAALAYLAKNHPELKNPTPADIAWAQGKLPSK